MGLGFSGGADFLHREAAGLLAERLADVTRDFAQVALLGTGAGVVADALRPDGAGLTQFDPSPVMAAQAGAGVLTGEILPLPEASFDLVVSTLLLHFANDPVGQLVQMRHALRPDGLMLAALFGGQTLNELRSSLAEAEVECEGGLSPRVAPMAEIRDLGALLQRAGFAMPVADTERLVVTYATPLHLMRELRAMGETNILTGRRRQPMRRATLMRACEIYARHFGTPEGRVRATFEIIFLTGWAPGPGQPKPLRPGSATTRLADALGTREISAGEKAGK
jgi:SAM-dependent methyltransferase